MSVEGGKGTTRAPGTTPGAGEAEDPGETVAKGVARGNVSGAGSLAGGAAAAGEAGEIPGPGCRGRVEASGETAPKAGFSRSTETVQGTPALDKTNVFGVFEITE